ncbi:TadE/TadG family type IV pilus assembly protein [Wenxinia saemankumensis]|uniref:Flp pilus assembly protein TadG n=1 Tax=Wenxinia saemankumensis TaxID=1447782 RepID=A0A1M6GZ89_9RHOB|nr:hypothetical protein [Wenxinia saemankumensis]SHJ15236.1 hypothetical protein SAMN05444417_3013 [Wenxinia saemankumensis]
MRAALHALAASASAPFRREDGSVTVEAVIMLPAILWCYLGTYVFFDAYRAQTVNIKAAYTIGDTLSRETSYVTPAFIDTMSELQQFLVGGDEPMALRVTVIGYDADEDRYVVRWSEPRGGPPALTDAGLAAARAQIPVMSPVERAIVVETWVDYEPGFRVGIDAFTFEDFVVTRPRGGQLCFNEDPEGSFLDAVC